MQVSGTKVKKQSNKQIKEEEVITTTPFPSSSPYNKPKKKESQSTMVRKNKKASKKEKGKAKNDDNMNTKKLEASLSDMSLTLKSNSSNLRLNNRRRCSSTTRPVTSLSQVVDQIKEGIIKNVIVMVGAGISTKSGIPDFRSPETGLYANLKQFQLKDPCDVFDFDYFLKNPRPFFELAKELYPSGKYLPNEAHFFIKILHDHGILKRLYTQNIDGLERVADIPEEKLIEAHGTFNTATCIKCKKQCKGKEIKNLIFDGQIPRCHMTIGCRAVVKPDIVFFGEDLPKRFFTFQHDFIKCDLLIIMGTSLQVQPFADLINSVNPRTPRILFNREKVGPFVRCRRNEDFTMMGEISDITRKFINMLGWEDQLDNYLHQQHHQQKKKAARKDYGRTSPQNNDRSTKEKKKNR